MSEPRPRHMLIPIGGGEPLGKLGREFTLSTTLHRAFVPSMLVVRGRVAVDALTIGGREMQLAGIYAPSDEAPRVYRIDGALHTYEAGALIELRATDKSKRSHYFFWSWRWPFVRRARETAIAILKGVSVC